jgi:hypothetical protein
MKAMAGTADRSQPEGPTWPTATPSCAARERLLAAVRREDVAAVSRLWA